MTAAETLIAAAIVFGPLAFGAVEPWSIALLAVFIQAAVVATAWTSEPDLRHPAVRTILPAIAAVALIGSIQRMNPVSVLQPASLAPHTVSAYFTGRAILLWATYAAAVWGASQALRGSNSARRIASVILAVGALIAVIGIIQGVDKDAQRIYGVRSAVYPLDPFGPYYNRDHAGSLLVMAALCGGGLLIDRIRSAGETDLAERVSIALLIGFGIALCAAGILLTRSAGALISLLIGALVLGVALPWRARLALFCAMFVLPLIVARSRIARIVPNHVSRSLAEKLTPSHGATAVAGRLQIHSGGWRALKDSPVFGAGLGAFQQAYYPYQDKNLKAIVEHAHGDPLELLVQVGAVGFAAVALGLAALLLRSASQLLRRPSGLACGIGGAAIAFLVHGLVDFPFQTPANAVIFLVLLALLGSLAHGEPIKSARHPSLALAALAVVLTVSQFPAAVASLRHLSRDLDGAVALDQRPRYRYELAKFHREDDPRAALEHLDAALRIDPGHPDYRALRDRVLERFTGARP